MYSEGVSINITQNGEPVQIDAKYGTAIIGPGEPFSVTIENGNNVSIKVKISFDGNDVSDGEFITVEAGVVREFGYDFMKITGTRLAQKRSFNHDMNRLIVSWFNDDGAMILRRFSYLMLPAESPKSEQCTNCNQKVLTQYKFCPHCGTGKGNQ